MADEPATTRFLNVDLDLRARSGLAELVRALEPTMSVMNHHGDFASLELHEQPEDIDDAMRRFVELIHALPPEVRALWDGCESRQMNIGIQAGAEPHSIGFGLSFHSMRLLVGIGAEVEFIVYGARSCANAPEALTPRGEP
ncbi:hypothetical protein F0U62_21745 [Cystobacter fuscus]|uniref:hypothetical protein n=1 Tax=Cystobacter fuscus TaxID=43 RepID=UPI002B2EDCD5|nr:hypothetical protein F0U62_21745 [Cystobacter fuscus]